MEKKNGEKGGEVGGQRLLFSGPVVRAERKWGQGCPGFGTGQVEEEGAGHRAPLELRGARTRAPCGRAAAAWGRRRRVAHGGGRGRERRERGGGCPVGQPVEWVPPISGGKREGERMAGGPRLRLNVFKLVQKCSNLIRPKTDLLKLQKFELKYGFEGFDERNNFLHRNFSRLEMYFVLKFRESKV
jgi:hypothetical protein